MLRRQFLQLSALLPFFGGSAAGKEREGVEGLVIVGLAKQAGIKSNELASRTFRMTQQCVNDFAQAARKLYPEALRIELRFASDPGKSVSVWHQLSGSTFMNVTTNEEIDLAEPKSWAPVLKGWSEEGMNRKFTGEIIGGPFHFWSDSGHFRKGYEKARKDAGLSKLELKEDYLHYWNGVENGFYVFLEKQKVKVEIEEIT